MTITLGRTLEPLRVNVIHNSDQPLELAFWTDAAQTIPANVTGSVMEIIFTTPDGTDVTWTATCAGQSATWNVPASEADRAWSSAPCRLVIDGILVAAGTIQVHRWT